MLEHIINILSHLVEIFICEQETVFQLNVVKPLTHGWDHLFDFLNSHVDQFGEFYHVQAAFLRNVFEYLFLQVFRC